MGFNVTALAQKARTQTLIVDSDLDMGQYDVIATDVKGDTAEFSEFVGGVGNFTSGLFSGGVDVSGILHAEGNTQVDGNIILEGSINNVNIADDGEITTTKGVNGADFNGATITATKFNGATIDANGNITGGNFNGVVLKSSGSITVTPNNTLLGYMPSNTDDISLTILPPHPQGLLYTGSIKFKGGSGNSAIGYYNGSNATMQYFSLNANTTGSLSFTNISFLTAYNTAGTMSMYGFKLT